MMDNGGFDLTSYSTLLFDLDGTLTNPEEGITKSVQYALRHMGINEPDRAKLTHFIGPPLAKSFQECYGMDREQAKTAVHYYRDYFSKTGIFENKLYPGITELLTQLQRKRKTLVVATSKPEIFARTIVRHFALDTFFLFVAGSNLDGSRVEKAEVIEYALKNISCRASCAVLMIGDRKHDVIGAKANGIDSLAVGYGFGSQEELVAAAPTYYAESVDALTHQLLKQV